MKLTRSTKHILKYQTNLKENWLKELFDIYDAELHLYLEMLFLGEMKFNKYPKKGEIKSIYIHGGQWKQVVYKDAFQRYLKHGVMNERKPVIKNFTINLDSRFFNILQDDSKEFDGFVEIALPFVKKNSKVLREKIRLPFKHYQHSQKYLNWKLLKTIQLKKINNNYYLVLLWEKETPNKKSKGNIIGFDCGYKHFLVDSNKNFYGTDLNSIYQKLARAKRGSKNYEQLLEYRNNRINEVINKLPLQDTKQVIAEDLKNVKKDSKFSKNFNNKLQYWTYRRGLEKLSRLCEENGILFTQVEPAFTSQLCTECGKVHEENRKGEKFKCTFCEYEEHADVVGAKNILNRGLYSASARKSNKSKIL